MLEEHVQFCAISGANKGHYHWLQDTHDELCNTKGVFNVAPDYIREHASNFLSSIHSGQMPALLARAMAYCQKDSQVVLGKDTMIDRAQVALEELIGDHKKGYYRSATEYDGGMGNNASFVQSLRNEAAALEQSGQTGMGSTTFRLLASVFQMHHEELAEARKSQAFDRNGPAFLQVFLGSGDAELARMAVDVLGGVPNAALPSHRKSIQPQSQAAIKPAARQLRLDQRGRSLTDGSMSAMSSSHSTRLRPHCLARNSAPSARCNAAFTASPAPIWATPTLRVAAGWLWRLATACRMPSASGQASGNDRT
jgi:hypothetical protein